MKILISCTIVFLTGLSMTSCLEDAASDLLNEVENSLDSLVAESVSEPILDIVNAESIAIMESDGTEATNLFKVTFDGALEEITFVPKNSNDSSLSSTIIVNNTLNLSSKYLLLEGNFSVWDTLGNSVAFTALLVDKTTGSIFDFGESDIDFSTTMLGDDNFQEDESENIYYSSTNGQIYKLDISDPESIQKEEYLSSGQSAEFYGIERGSNCVYKYGESSGVTSSNGTNDLRLRKNSGGIFEIAIDGRDNNEFWIGTDGKVYFTTYTWSNGYLPLINSLTITGDAIEIDTVWTPSTEDENNAVGKFFRTNSQGSFLIKKENSVVFIDTYFGSIKSFEFSESDKTVSLIDLPAINEGAKIVSSQQYYYIASGTDFYKVSLSDHSYSELLTSGAYEIYSMDVSDDDIVQLSALRFSDGKKIFAEISASNQLTIIDQEQDKKGVVLQKLN